MVKHTLNQRSTLLENLHDRNIIIDTREIFLHSNYSTDNDDEEPGVDYRMAVSFEKNLRFLQYVDSTKPILIHQHCHGGSIADGFAIYDTIKASPCHITVLVYAQASSMSSLMMQAADLRILMPTCEVLLHFGHGELNGSVDAVMSGAVRWGDLKQHFLKIYAEQMHKSDLFKEKKIEEVMKWLEEKLCGVSDWYLTSQLAVKFGLADHVLGEGPYKQISDLL